MWLLIDVGNTRLKWAAVPAPPAPAQLGQWLACGNAGLADLGQLTAKWRAMPIGRILVANVAGDAIRRQLERLFAMSAAPVAIEVEWFASSASAAGVRSRYRRPEQLGCDRFAAAIGAHALFPAQPLIVASCGTATTIDAVSADGVFIGGLILPGLDLMTTSLAKNTAQLPQVNQGNEKRSLPFADNTDDAILSGCIAAQVGAIERAVRLHPDPAVTATCVLAGGAAKSIAPVLSVPYNMVDNLVLVGLHAVAIDQQQSGATC
ncbi:MAG: type III pantothenate kinase [Pseudomonadota bacterium]